MRRGFSTPDESSIRPAPGSGLSIVDAGSGVITYPGASQVSNGVSVPHNLGNVPVSVVTQAGSVNHYTRPASFSPTQFTVQGRTLDGTSPAAGTQVPFWWVAYA